MDEFDQTIISMFDDTMFINYWHSVDNAYKELGLGADMTDEDKLTEYVYITQQLRKFKSSHKDQILQHGKNYVSMLNEVTNLINSLPEWDTNSRPSTVYCMLRNGMLQTWVNVIYDVIKNISAEEIEEE